MWTRNLGKGTQVIGFWALTVGLINGPASGQKLATVISEPGAPIGGSGSFLGWEFTVSTAVEVTAFGQWDKDGNGLLGPATIALFDKDSEALLRTAIVEAGPVADLENQFRLVTLDPAIPLQPNKSYIIASNVADQAFRTDNYGGVSPVFTTAPEVEIIRWWFESGTEVRFPTRPEGPTLPEWVGRAFLGPTFKFTGGSQPPAPASQDWAFSGPLKLVEDAGNATFSALQVPDAMEGRVAIPLSDADATFSPPATHAFPSSQYHGEITGADITVSTAGSARPLEFSFFDDLELDPEALELINECLGLNLPAGTRVDLAEIESDRTIGNRRLEIGLSFISLDLELLDGSDYRAFPTLEEVDLALYFVVEEENDEEIYNALGLITEFGPIDTSIRVADVTLQGDLLVLQFNAAPGISDWQLKGSSDPSGGFNDLLPATITEDPVVAGKYRVEADVAGKGPTYLVRVER